VGDAEKNFQAATSLKNAQVHRATANGARQVSFLAQRQEPRFAEKVFTFLTDAKHQFEVNDPVAYLYAFGELFI